MGDTEPADHGTGSAVQSADDSPDFLHVIVHRAVDLEDKDFRGKSDPYAVILYNDHKVGRSIFTKKKV